MSAKKRQRLMFAILIVSVLFGLLMKPWERRNRPADASQADPASEQVAAVSARPMLAEVAYVTEWPSRDPFSRPDEKSPVGTDPITDEVSLEGPSFALQGIMTVGGQMVCVIDGVSRNVGSQIAGWKVEKIEAQGVWVSQGGERHHVPLP